MREDVGADDRLGARDRPAGGVRHEARQWAQAKRIDAGAPGRRVAKRHDDLFQSRIARPLAKSKHGDAGAGGAGAKRRERVGGGEAEIVMTMELKRERSVSSRTRRTASNALNGSSRPSVSAKRSRVAPSAAAARAMRPMSRGSAREESSPPRATERPRPTA